MNTVNLVASLHHETTAAWGGNTKDRERRGERGRDAGLVLHQLVFLLISTSSFAVSLLSFLFLILFFFPRQNVLLTFLHLSPPTAA